MADNYKTARGAQIDMNRLKTKNEKVIAVGNSGTNARGDEVRGGTIVRTREEIMQDHYAIRGNNVAKEAKIRSSDNFVEPDLPPMNFNSPVEAIQKTETKELDQKPLENAPRGGLANAVNRSQNLAEVMDTQRKRI